MTVQQVREETPAGLIPLHKTPSATAYLRELWRRREYAMRVPVSELRARNLNNVFGMLWFVLNPVMLVAVYFLFFGLILGTDRGVDNFITFLASGIFTFTYLQRTMTSASRTLIAHIGLIRAIRFPRAILPISSTIEQSIAQLPVLLVLIVVALATGEVPGPTWLLFAPLLVLEALFALGIGLMLARATTHFRDVQNFLPFAFRLLLYMSGVLYSVDAFVEDETLRLLFYLNPFYCHIEMVRYAVFGGEFPTWAAVGALVSTIIVVPVGFVVFRRGEPYGRA